MERIFGMEKLTAPLSMVTVWAADWNWRWCATSGWRRTCQLPVWAYPKFGSAWFRRWEQRREFSAPSPAPGSNAASCIRVNSSPLPGHSQWAWWMKCVPPGQVLTRRSSVRMALENSPEAIRALKRLIVPDAERAGFRDALRHSAVEFAACCSLDDKNDSHRHIPACLAGPLRQGASEAVAGPAVTTEWRLKSSEVR